MGLRSATDHTDSIGAFDSLTIKGPLYYLFAPIGLEAHISPGPVSPWPHPARGDSVDQLLLRPLRRGGWVSRRSMVVVASAGVISWPVIEEGDVQKNSEIKIINRHPQKIPVYEINRMFYGKTWGEMAIRLLQNDALPPGWREHFSQPPA